MYDWLTWADVWCPFILQDIQLQGTMPPKRLLMEAPQHCPVSQTFTQLVHRFHQACVYFIRPTEDTDEYSIRCNHFHIKHYA